MFLTYYTNTLLVVLLDAYFEYSSLVTDFFGSLTSNTMIVTRELQ